MKNPFRREKPAAVSAPLHAGGSPMKTIEQVLSELPSASRDIARLVRDRGITGSPGSSSSCPLAKYFSRETGAVFYVVDNLVLTESGAGWPLPSGVVDFVDRFDRGYFPDLESS